MLNGRPQLAGLVKRATEGRQRPGRADRGAGRVRGAKINWPSVCLSPAAGSHGNGLSCVPHADTGVHSNMSDVSVQVTVSFIINAAVGYRRTQRFLMTFRGQPRLRPCARKEAANLRSPVGAHVWPDDGRPELIRLCHHCIIGHDDPFTVEPHAIVAVLRVPIDVVDLEAIGEGAAESVAAREPVKPGFQWRIGIPAIVTRERNGPPAADRLGKFFEVDRVGRCQRPNKHHRYEQDLTHHRSTVLKAISALPLATQGKSSAR